MLTHWFSCACAWSCAYSNLTSVYQHCVQGLFHPGIYHQQKQYINVPSKTFLIVFFYLCSGLTVKCSRDSMIAILDLMKFPNMDTGTMTLNDASCKATHVNDTHAIIETPLDGCGTTHNASEDYLHYYNNIKISRIKKNVSSDAIITRDHEALFPFQCSYDRKTVLSVVSFSPRMKLVYTREGNTEVYCNV